MGHLWFGFYVYWDNKDEKIVPGVNPIVFENLSDYVKYVEWEEQNNRECPVLYFQEIVCV